MHNYSKDGITVASILDNRRETIKGTYPVKIRVTYKRERKYYSTGKNLSQNDWEKLPTVKAKGFIEIRENIENSFSIIKSHVVSLIERGEFTFDALNLRLSRVSGGTINTIFQLKVEALKNEERIGSMLYYESVLKGIEIFAGKQVSIDAITIDWLKQYEKHMLKTKNHTTVGMHMRAIRAIMNNAKKTGIIKESQYPFGMDKYEIRTGEGRKKALTLEQIAKIVKYSDENETTMRYRDMWFFMYLCNGINTADLVKLKYSNIIDGEICYIRQKTERTTRTIKEIRAIVTPEMQAIINRWGNKPNKENYIFSYLSDGLHVMKINALTNDLTRRINKRMKIIGEALGIDGITTYTARHSFATVLKRSGANIAFISESLGHSDLKTTENYLASFERGEREKNAKLLTNFEVSID